MNTQNDGPVMINFVGVVPPAPACPFCKPELFAFDKLEVPAAKLCADHENHPAADIFLDPQIRRPATTAAEHNAFPNGRWS